MRELVAGKEHLFQQPDFIKENSKRVKELVAENEHFFQQPEFIKENRGGKGKTPRNDKWLDKLASVKSFINTERRTPKSNAGDAEEKSLGQRIARFKYIEGGTNSKQ